MAGQSLGAPAPFPVSASDPAAPSAPAASRTRRSHGVFLIGDALARVYSSRREADGLVYLSVGSGPLALAGSMTPAQARAMARALTAAATAAQGQGGAA